MVKNVFHNSNNIRRLDLADHSHFLTHVTEFFEHLWNNRYWYMASIGGAAGAIWWAILKVFPTHSAMNACKKDIAIDFDNALKAHEEREKEQFSGYKKADEFMHQSLGRDIEYIKGRVDSLVDHLLKK